MEFRDEPGEAAFLEQALLADLHAANRQACNSRLTLTLRDGDRIVAGIDGTTAYGWLLIKVLWVDTSLRGRQIGRGLVDRAIGIARTRGCHGAWLDTSDPGARVFYRKLGFVPFGTLANEQGQPCETHRRWFMRRDIDTCLEQG